MEEAGSRHDFLESSWLQKKDSVAYHKDQKEANEWIEGRPEPAEKNGANNLFLEQ